MNKRVLFIELSIVLLILLIGTYIFRTTDLDLQIQRAFYSETEGWYQHDLPLFKFLYHWGNIPAILLVILALNILGISFKYHKLKIYRKISLFIVLSMLIGPGLIVNTIFKDHWGRPRPRHIEEFGGREEHLPLWTKGVSGTGNSFPCGHASMGYFFFVIFFILRKKRKFLAWLSLIFALSFGTLIGVARIAQGGHFASDVLWTAGFLYLTTLALYHLLRIEKFPYWTRELNSKITKPAVVILLALIPLSIAIMLLASPYHKEDTISPANFDSDNQLIAIKISRGDVVITPADSLHISLQSQGFGFPGSKLRYDMTLDTVGNISYPVLTIFTKGMFTELRTQVTISLPPVPNNLYYIQTSRGRFFIDAEELSDDFEVIRTHEEENVVFRYLQERDKTIGHLPVIFLNAPVNK